jgi:D-sedoheptulose 7-phosphate isomerase
MSTENNLATFFQQSLEESQKAKQVFWEEQGPLLLKACALFTEALKNGNKILAFGNGGSACDAQHFSLELVNRLIFDRPGLACIALPADGALLTCIANDYSFEEIFSRQVQALGRPGDIAFGISTSGNSKNVIKAFQEARKLGLKTVAMTGGTGGRIQSEKLADIELCVSGSKSTPRIQETHEWILHSICYAVEVNLFGAMKP